MSKINKSIETEKSDNCQETGKEDNGQVLGSLIGWMNCSRMT